MKTIKSLAPVTFLGSNMIGNTVQAKAQTTHPVEDRLGIAFDTLLSMNYWIDGQGNLIMAYLVILQLKNRF
jgi:hypothetical protein